MAAQPCMRLDLNQPPLDSTAASPLPPPPAAKKLPFFRRFGKTRDSNRGEGPPSNGVPDISVDAPSLLSGGITREDLSLVVKHQGRRLKQGAKSSYKFSKDLVVA